MSIIKVNCVDQTLVFENTPVIASGGLEENFVQFSFCSQWDGFTKTAVFWRSESEVFHNPLDAEDGCQVPPEVTASDGVIYFGVFGVDSAGRQRTSEVLTYRIVKGAITEGTVPSDPTPDIYTQLLAKYQEMVEIAEDTRKKEQAFETAMTERQNTFEEALTKKVDDDQGAFEEAMTKDQAAFEQTIIRMIEDGLLPDDSITTEKLKDGVVTAEKIAPGVLIDAFTKTETMTADTAGLFGLGAEAVPDDVFGVLSRFQNGLGNEYVWAKTKSETNVNLGSGTTHTSGLYLGTAIKGGIFYYSDDPLAVAQKTCDAYTSSASTTAEELQTLLAGKYFTVSNVSHEIYYADPTVTFSVADWDYWQVANITQYANFEVYTTTTVFGYVNSPNPTAYPIDDGYTYTALGQLGAKVQIATGSYTGTDTYNVSNPNSLTFEFEPKLLIISAVYNNNAAGCIAVIVPGLCGSYSSQGLGDKAGSYVNILGSGKSGNTVTWYSNGGAGMQLNSSAVTYNYIAIG